jgi:hypothetical protein
MKATHKLVSLASGAMWDLADTERGLYYKMTSPRQSDGWSKSISTLRAYMNNEDFSCKQINKFKGNK